MELTIAPHATSRITLLHATKEDHMPYPVPMSVGSLMRIGIDPMKGKTLSARANEAIRIGAMALTVVNPMSANATT